MSDLVAGFTNNRQRKPRFVFPFTVSSPDFEHNTRLLLDINFVSVVLCLKNAIVSRKILQKLQNEEQWVK